MPWTQDEMRAFAAKTLRDGRHVKLSIVLGSPNDNKIKFRTVRTREAA